MPSVNFLLYRRQDGTATDWAVVAAEDGSYPKVPVADGAYYVIGGDGVATADRTVADLTVAISGGSGIGSTLSASTNGTAGVTYQWQADGSDIPGATSATFETTGRTEAEVITCDVADGGQTAPSNAITLTAALPSFSNYAVSPSEVAAALDHAAPLNTVNSRAIISAVRFEVPGVDGYFWSSSPNVRNVAFGIEGGALTFQGQDATDGATQGFSVSAGTLLTPGDTVSAILVTGAEGNAIRVRMGLKIAGGPPVLDMDLTRDASGGFLTYQDSGAALTTTFTVFDSRSPGDGTNDWPVGVPFYGARVYVGADAAAMPDLSDGAALSNVFDAVFNADGSFKAPADGDTLFGLTPRFDTAGKTAAEHNNLENFGSAGAFASKSGTFA